MLGHRVTVIDYDDTWKTRRNSGLFPLSTTVLQDIHRAYPEASVTVHRPGMVRLPVLSRISGAITAGAEIARVMRDTRFDAVLLYGLPTVGIQSLLAAQKFNVPVIFRSIDVLNQLVPWRVLIRPTKALERYVYNRADVIVPVTLHLKNHILSYGVPESRVRVLPL